MDTHQKGRRTCVSFSSSSSPPPHRFGASGSLVSVPSYVKRRRLETKRILPVPIQKHFSLIHLLLLFAIVLPIGSGCRCTRPPCPKAQAGKRGGWGRLVVISGPPHLLPSSPPEPAITSKATWGSVSRPGASRRRLRLLVPGDGRCPVRTHRSSSVFFFPPPPPPSPSLFYMCIFLFFQSDGLPRGGNY